MESPLSRMERGTLRPKVLDLIDSVFGPNASTEPKSDGFWEELFLLPSNPGLYTAIDTLSRDQLLSYKANTQQFFLRATARLKTDPDPDNILRNLSHFLRAVFAKQFVSQSSELISILAGLNNVDKAFYNLIDGLDTILCSSHPLSTKVNAIRTFTIAVGGSYQTSLAPYFINCPKDMFSSLIDFIRSPDADFYVGDAFTLVGVLASFDKFDAPHNPYRGRLTDFVDQATMTKISQSSGHVWKICLDNYQSSSSNPSGASTAPGTGSNTPTGKSPSPSPLSIAYFLGFRSATPQNSDTTSTNNDNIPHKTISLMLAIYEFVYANKLFARQFLKAPPLTQEKVHSASSEPSFVLFLQLCSWLVQNEHVSSRASAYTRIQLLILRLLIEKSGQELLSDECRTTGLNLARLRNPMLPPYDSKKSRTLMEGVLDCLQLCIRHNMRTKEMDYQMYQLAMTSLVQALAYFRSARARIDYHWDELWKTLMSIIRFINSHVLESTSPQYPSQVQCGHLLMLALAICLIDGEDTILGHDWHYHDLIYKLIASEKDIDKIINLLPSETAPATAVISNAIIHYKSVVSDTSSAKKVSESIKTATATKPANLSQFVTSFSETDRQTVSILLYGESLPKFRESDERLFFKRFTRQVLSDIQSLYT